MKMGYLYIAVVLLIVVAAAAAWWQQPREAAITDLPNLEIPDDLFNTDKQEAQQTQKEIISAFEQNNQIKTYQNSKYSFSFSYPDEYTVGSFPEGEGDTVLLQDSVKGIGLQVTISPFDENLPKLTEARVREDLPDLDMRDVREIVIENTPALFFVSSGTDFGTSAEVWFIHAGNLYQMSTYTEQIPLLERVLTTFSFK